MAVDFGAEPSPEGMELATRLRAERRQRDKQAEDRIAAAEEESLLAEGRVSELPLVGAAQPEQDAQDDEKDRDRSEGPSLRPVTAPGPGAEPTPQSGPSIKDRIDEMAAVSQAMARTRTTDRQR